MYHLRWPSPNPTMIYTCWTPISRILMMRIVREVKAKEQTTFMQQQPSWIKYIWDLNQTHVAIMTRDHTTPNRLTQLILVTAHA